MSSIGYGKLLLGIGLSLGICACGNAQEPATAPKTSAPAAAGTTVPAVIGALQKQGFELIGEFDAPGGLRGFAGVAGQRPVAAYLTPDGKHAVVGVLLDEHGQDAAAATLQDVVAKPMSARIWSELDKSTWVADGRADAPRIVYTFSDANCPYCHRFWEAARPWVESGKVQLRHVIVGVIREDSANKAAAILQAKNPSEAFVRNEHQFSAGGIPGLASVPADVRRKLLDNENLMLELGFHGTPGILFRDANGVVQRRAGLPQGEDLTTVLGPR